MFNITFTLDGFRNHWFHVPRPCQFRKSMLGDYISPDIENLWRHCAQFEEWADHPVIEGAGEDLGRFDLSQHSCVLVATRHGFWKQGSFFDPHLWPRNNPPYFSLRWS